MLAIGPWVWEQSFEVVVVFVAEAVVAAVVVIDVAVKSKLTDIEHAYFVVLYKTL